MNPKLQKIWVKLYPVSLTDRLFFTDNLRVMMRAGLPLSDSLKTLSAQTERKYFKEVIDDLRTSIEKGETLSAAMNKHPDVFPSVFVSMISVGELSGTLEANLEQLGIQLKKDHTLRSRVKSAMTYPTLVLTATFGIVAVMIVYVIPRMVSIFKDVKIDLPLSTRALIAISDFAVKYTLFLALTLAATVGAILFFIKKTTAGRRAWHALILHLPVFGKIAVKVNIARFTRTLSSLLATDVPVVKSLEISADVLGNTHYKNAALQTAEEIKKGISIADALSKYRKLFPPLILQMVTVGERSGTLDSLLKEVAVFYEEQVDETLKGLSSIIEPLLILVLGGAVGGIAISIMSPIYTLTQTF
ncbi:type II secretion system F family protein [Candidatus Uhrbacteria bacterium]|nr:type II secretion system F family protein [Candidatus Uhrbacteria bacterium]